MLEELLSAGGRYAVHRVRHAINQANARLDASAEEARHQASGRHREAAERLERRHELVYAPVEALGVHSRAAEPVSPVLEDVRERSQVT